jgi:hypothetical protein
MAAAEAKREDRIDAVVIVTPTASHYEIVPGSRHQRYLWQAALPFSGEARSERAAEQQW